ncbi:hypothetical protein LTR85_010017 [Meristemomyces frigidus]|nr:hypothetical protein LTR85_010017 [Meristemomyces frigidus]
MDILYLAGLLYCLNGYLEEPRRLRGGHPSTIKQMAAQAIRTALLGDNSSTTGLTEWIEREHLSYPAIAKEDFHNAIKSVCQPDGLLWKAPRRRSPRLAAAADTRQALTFFWLGPDVVDELDLPSPAHLPLPPTYGSRSVRRQKILCRLKTAGPPPRTRES